MEALEDRLSSLLDGILVYILYLSHMPINYAAATSVLSCRWRFLWTRINRLVLDRRYFPRSYMMYKTFDHIFQQLTSSKIDAFYLHAYYPTLSGSVDECFSALDSLFHQLSQRQVREIGITLHFNYAFKNYAHTYLLVLNNPHLVVLKLYTKLEVDIVNLANLELIYLSLGCLPCEVLNNLIESSPKLKKMSVFGRITTNRTPSFYLSSQKLEYLNVASLNDGELVIDTPNLKHLELDTGTQEKYRFLTKPSELMSAKISLWRAFDFFHDDVRSHGLGIFRGVSNVRHLSIEDGVMKALKLLHNVDGFPCFERVTTLTIDFVGCKGIWNDVWFSVICFPNLKYVRVNQRGWCYNKRVIEPHSNLVHEPLTQFKTIKFDGLTGTPDYVAAINYALSNFETLELLILDCSSYFREGNYEERLRECQKFHHQVLLLPKRSTKCEIKFHGVPLSSSK